MVIKASGLYPAFLTKHCSRRREEADWLVGPALGMKLFASDSNALWLSCGALGLLSAMIIFGRGTTQPVQALHTTSAALK